MAAINATVVSKEETEDQDSKQHSQGQAGRRIGFRIQIFHLHSVSSNYLAVMFCDMKAFPVLRRPGVK